MKKNLPIKNKLIRCISLLLFSVIFIALISGCAGVTISHGSSNQNSASNLQSETKNTTPQNLPKLTFAKNDEFVVLISKKGDTLESLALTYLGDIKKSWVIADFNNITKITAKREIIIPLKSHNTIGITQEGVQAIPILCYHRFGKGHTKLAVSEEKFKQQMQYLKDNNFNVIPLRDLYAFLENKSPLPKKTVIITIDDGYKSTYEIAFPILKAFNFPATLFLYTDFTGARDAVSWKQAKKMLASGLIDIQSHSKTHPNMSLKKDNETNTMYKKRINTEIETPEKEIERRLKYKTSIFAYPYGDTNESIINILEKNNYTLGVTVQPGSNTAFSPPYMLKRTMIFGDHDIKDFSNSLVVLDKNFTHQDISQRK